MKQFFYFITFLILFGAPAWCAEYPSLPTGIFRYHKILNDPRVKEIGGYLEIIKKQNNKYEAIIEIAWVYGVEVGFDGEILYNKSPKTKGEWVMTFDEDSFRDSGYVIFKPLSNDKILIDIKCTKISDGRATRQYGEYTLTRSKK